MTECLACRAVAVPKPDRCPQCGFKPGALKGDGPTLAQLVNMAHDDPFLPGILDAQIKNVQDYVFESIEIALRGFVEQSGLTAEQWGELYGYAYKIETRDGSMFVDVWATDKATGEPVFRGKP